MRVFFVLALSALAQQQQLVAGFVAPRARAAAFLRARSAPVMQSASAVLSSMGVVDRPQKWVDFMSQPVNPGVLSTLIKGKRLNGWGILYALSTFAIAVGVMPAMLLVTLLSDLLGNKKVRRPSLPRGSSQPSFPNSSSPTTSHHLRPPPQSNAACWTGLSTSGPRPPCSSAPAGRGCTERRTCPRRARRSSTCPTTRPSSTSSCSLASCRGPSST